MTSGLLRVLLPDPTQDDSPIVLTHSDALLAGMAAPPAATRSWVRSGAGDGWPCSRPVMSTWAATWP